MTVATCTAGKGEWCPSCVCYAGCPFRAPVAPVAVRGDKTGKDTRNPDGRLYAAAQVRQRWSGPSVPVLGVDPGVHTGLAVVRGGLVLHAWSIDWSRDAAWLDLQRAVEYCVASGYRVAVVEVLGPTKGAARGRASSWVTMGECAGRVLQELDRAGIRVIRRTPGEWRGILGLPASFGDRGEKDEAAKRYARELLGFDAPSGHVAEAALIAAGGEHE